VAYLREATLTGTGGNPHDYLLAALSWASIANKWSHSTSLDAFNASIGLLEVWLASGSSLESRHGRLTLASLKRTRSLAVDGAACAIGLSRIETAVEILERGRSLLLTQAGRYRTHIDDLEVINPTLVREFRTISQRMEASTMRTAVLDASPASARVDPVATYVPSRLTGNTLKLKYRSYQRLSAEWNDVVKKIRTVKGFESFLQPTNFQTLRMAAEEGPIIVVNISAKRSDAIIVLFDRPPVLVPLPKATPKSIAKLADKTSSATPEKDMKIILKTIWHVIVQPISAALSTDIQLKRGSRIWWCPTGAASFLPLHAAGDYNKRGETLLDQFISSYTSTFTTLMSARSSKSTSGMTKPDMVIIGQSQDPTLPTVRAEIETIQSIVKVDTTLLDEGQATHDVALGALSRYSWVHLACHGELDEDHPFN
jgi:hypothetical protein